MRFKGLSHILTGVLLMVAVIALQGCSEFMAWLNQPGDYITPAARIETPFERDDALSFSPQMISAIPRGYQPRACNFDMDDDLVFGEPEDCQVGDGVTLDPDGDGVNEDLLYVDCGQGSDQTGDGSPQNPYATVGFAMDQADGPGDGAEDIIAFTGICDNEPEKKLVTLSGLPDIKIRPQSGNEARSFEYPANPAMIVGWDKDNDGEYPPFDTDDLSVFFGGDVIGGDPERCDGADDNAGKGQVFVLERGGERWEMGHFQVREYGTCSTERNKGFMEYRTQTATLSHLYTHDISMRYINRKEASGHDVILRTFNGKMKHAAWENIEVLDYGSYFQRGGVGVSEEVGPFRFKNFTLRCAGAPVILTSGSPHCTGFKLWQFVTGVEVLNFFAEVLPDLPERNGLTRPVSSTSGFSSFSTCIQDVVVRNNEILNFRNFGGISIEASVCDALYPSGENFGNPHRSVDRELYEGNIFRITDPNMWASNGIFRIHSCHRNDLKIEDVSLINNFFSISGSTFNPISIECGINEVPDRGTYLFAGNTFNFNDPVGSRLLKLICGDGSDRSHVIGDVRFINNIFRAPAGTDMIRVQDCNGDGVVDYDNLVFEGNVYSPGMKFDWMFKPNAGSLYKGDFAGWQSASGLDLSSSECEMSLLDPLNGDLHVVSTDTCVRDRGADVVALSVGSFGADGVRFDVDGQMRPIGSGNDSGADESNGDSAPPPPPPPGEGADLSLTVAVTPAQPQPGQPISFEFTVNNAGPTNATGLSVQLSLEFTPEGGTPQLQTQTVPFEDVASGSSATMTLPANFPITGVATLTAELASADQSDPDSTPGNGDPAEDDYRSIAIGVGVAIGADLSVSTNLTPANPQPGQPISFSFTINNAGPLDATGLSVKMTFEFTPEGGSTQMQTQTVPFEDVVAGNSATMTMPATFPVSGAAVLTAELVSADQPDPDSVPGNGDTGEDDQDAQAFIVGNAPPPGPSADLSLNLSLDQTSPQLGDTVNFTVTVNNNGPDDATGVAVAASLPSGLALLSATPDQGIYDSPSGMWFLPGGVDSDADITLVLKARVDSVQSTFNVQVNASDQPDPDSAPGNNITGEDDQAVVTISVNDGTSIDPADLSALQFYVESTFFEDIGNFNRSIATCATQTCLDANDQSSIEFQFCDTTPESLGGVTGAKGLFPDGCVRRWEDQSGYIPSRGFDDPPEWVRGRDFGQDDTEKPGLVFNCINGHPCVRGAKRADSVKNKPPTDGRVIVNTDFPDVVNNDAQAASFEIENPDHFELNREFSVFLLVRPIIQSNPFNYYGGRGLRQLLDNSLILALPGNQTLLAGAGSVAINQWQLIEIHRDSNLDVRTFINGVDVSVSPLPRVGGTFETLGNYYAGVFSNVKGTGTAETDNNTGIVTIKQNYEYLGDMAVLGAWNRELTQQERQGVRNYLNGIYAFMP